MPPIEPQSCALALCATLPALGTSTTGLAVVLIGWMAICQFPLLYLTACQSNGTACYHSYWPKKRTRCYAAAYTTDHCAKP